MTTRSGTARTRTTRGTNGWAGCLAVVAGFVTGLAVWGVGAAPGLRGAFEGERDWSLLYLDGPVMIFGIPAVALGVWALVGGVLRARDGVAAVAVLLALAAVAWGCGEWLEMRTDRFTRGDSW
ncbi:MULTISPECIES: hypothetical protein [Streptomyces]|uniref:hypothetical protein n=1 Tax=Streptomyces TaxID=1883 RepID=UPI00084C6835|nr:MULTISPECIES: hypothetical protein [Streptomyces]TFI28561.1 hypothetical protein E4P36_09640 [Streptomyces sp. 4R-3d]